MNKTPTPKPSDPTQPTTVAIQVPDFLHWPAALGETLPPHVTLLFLGSLTASERARVSAIVSGVVAKFRPFKVQLAGVGHFDNRVRTTAYVQVWADEVFALRAALLATLGGSTAIDFAPHVTLGHLPKWARWAGDVRSGEFVARHVVMYDGTARATATFKIGGAA